ncbi:MAG: flagellar motor switch protein FliG [Acidimicrobiales bacterium]
MTQTKETEALTQRQKAAVMLVAVGPGEAAKILTYMTEEEVEIIATEISRLGTIPPSAMTSVLEEFHLQAIAQNYLVEGGLDYARELLVQWKGDRGEAIIEKLIATTQIAPFSFLSKMEPDQLLSFIQDEHPQTVALIFAHLPSHFAALLLAGLEEKLQAEVALRIATMDPTSPEIIRKVEHSLKLRLGSVSSAEMNASTGGIEELADLLNNAGRSVEKAILERLSDSDPELADKVRELMFVFEDILTLEDKDVQEILRKVDAKGLALATKGVKSEVLEMVMRNLSERAASTLKEEIEFIGKVKISDVEAAQSQVVAIIREMDEKGEITMRAGAEGGMIE